MRDATTSVVVPRILVVDDDTIFTSGLRVMLHGAGFEVDVAEDAHEALEILAEEQPDLALVDMMMPGASGLALLEEMQSHHPDIKAIGMSSRTDLDEAVYDRGAEAMLHKPLLSHEIGEAIWAYT